MKRIFLIVLDSFGIGQAEDADKFGDRGADTLKSVVNTGKLNIPTMKSLGLFNIDGLNFDLKEESPVGAYAKMREVSNGKDTTIGHLEIAGIISKTPFPTYPNGFPKEITDKLCAYTKRGVLCNKPYSGTKVIEDYGQKHIETGDLIIYTSADSVFQIAAHEDVVNINQLYDYCEYSRKILCGENAVARVIARPFLGEKNNFYRTENRRDFSLKPPSPNLLTLVKENKLDCIAVGKINDIFNGDGITKAYKTHSNKEGMECMDKLVATDFTGLCFVNLVDFDMLYGHRNNAPDYAVALNEFDAWLNLFLKKINDDDLVIITADHGCDPGDVSTDHTREYTPMLAYHNKIKGKNLYTRNSFSDIAKTILQALSIENNLYGQSFYKDLVGE